jgi:hypothetical protein
MTKLVELWAHEELFGLIVLVPSGVVFCNQTGGTMCAHPKAEGIYLPLLHGHASSPQKLIDLWRHAWKEYTPELIGQSLRDVRLDHILEPVSPADQLSFPQLDSWGEAWVPVKIKAADKYSENEAVLHAFAGQFAILTYGNSD